MTGIKLLNPALLKSPLFIFVRIQLFRLLSAPGTLYHTFTHLELDMHKVTAFTSKTETLPSSVVYFIVNEKEQKPTEGF